MEFAPGEQMDEIPDPYEGGTAMFEHAAGMVEAATTGFLRYLNYPPSQRQE